MAPASVVDAQLTRRLEWARLVAPGQPAGPVPSAVAGCSSRTASHRSTSRSWSGWWRSRWRSTSSRSPAAALTRNRASSARRPSGASSRSVAFALAGVGRRHRHHRPALGHRCRPRRGGTGEPARPCTSRSRWWRRVPMRRPRGRRCAPRSTPPPGHSATDARRRAAWRERRRLFGCGRGGGRGDRASGPLRLRPGAHAGHAARGRAALPGRAAAGAAQPGGLERGRPSPAQLGRQRGSHGLRARLCPGGRRTRCQDRRAHRAAQPALLRRGAEHRAAAPSRATTAWAS